RGHRKQSKIKSSRVGKETEPTCGGSGAPEPRTVISAGRSRYVCPGSSGSAVAWVFAVSGCQVDSGAHRTRLGVLPDYNGFTKKTCKGEKRHKADMPTAILWHARGASTMNTHINGSNYETDSVVAFTPNAKAAPTDQLDKAGHTILQLL